MALGINKILIIGLGLIGGSFALSIKKASPTIKLIGVDINSQTIRTALEKNIIDSGVSFDGEDSAKIRTLISSDDIDLIVLSTPVASYPEWFSLIASSDFSGIITDVGSTKEVAIKYADEYLNASKKFIPGHPMAGSESLGIDAARDDLFYGAYWILTPTEGTDNQSLEILHSLLLSINARVFSVDPCEHDRVVAIVSHVPHIAASALVTLAKDHSGEEGELLRLAATGFKDTTRVAAGNPELWTGILLDNGDIIADALKEFSKIITDIEEALRDNDSDKIKQILMIAADARKKLPSKWVPESTKLFEVRIPMGNRPGIIADITTIASKAVCNIQAIEIDHKTEERAVLQLTLTDEGNLETFDNMLKEAGFKPYIVEI